MHPWIQSMTLCQLYLSRILTGCTRLLWQSISSEVDFNSHNISKMYLSMTMKMFICKDKHVQKVPYEWSRSITYLCLGDRQPFSPLSCVSWPFPTKFGSLWENFVQPHLIVTGFPKLPEGVCPRVGVGQPTKNCRMVSSITTTPLFMVIWIRNLMNRFGLNIWW